MGYANIGRKGSRALGQSAERTRRAADQETDPVTTSTLLEIAEASEKLAALEEVELTAALPE